MKHRLLAIGALVLFVGIMGADMSLLHLPAVRNGPLTFFALLIPVALAIFAVKLIRSVLTIVMLTLVLLLSGGYVASRTILFRLPEGGPTAQAGAAASDFTLPSTSGKDLSLGSLRGTGQLVLVFYRGAW